MADMANRSFRILEDRAEGMPLGRHVEHDARSLLYRKAPAHTVNSVAHIREIPVLDQGDLGSCTGNAGTGAIGTDPIYTSLPGAVMTQLNEDYAVSLYSDATKVDDGEGSYPPEDTGSSGLAIMKVLKARGLIAGYTAATSVEEVKSVLQTVAPIIGIPWYQSFYEPKGASAVVSIAGQVAGGHEIELTEWDSKTDTFTCVNSWGTSWGDHGRFRFTAATFARLLAEQGDVYAAVPLTEPAPTPAPVASIWPAATVDPWLLKKHSGDSAKAAASVSVR
ncbi:hypothetical protein Q3G72_032508 [Acer saccharum]|nr:hypothetical protein Q3G72_032508 [Acer saccharum]